MPWNTGFSAQFYDKEVLKYPQAALVTKGIVIDATSVTLNSDRNQRTVVPAGTIMARLSGASNCVAYTGTGTIVGILSRAVDILVSATEGNEPGAVFFHDAIFDTTKIIGWTVSQNQTDLAAALTTCKFE